MRAGRIAIIGINGFGGTHVGAALRLGQAGEFVLQAVCESNFEASREKIEELTAAGVVCYRDYRDLLKNESGLDFVIVSTPIHLHRAMAVDILESGNNVLLEKPPAVTIQDVDSIVDATVRTGKTCAVDFMMTSGRAFLELKERIGRGELGAIRTITGKGLWKRLDSYYERAAWAGKLICNREYVLDGTLNNPLSHVLNNMLMLADAAVPLQIDTVTAELYHGHEIEAEDTSCVRVAAASGIELLFFATLCSPDEEETPEIVVEGTLGTAKWSYNNSLEIAAGGQTYQVSYGKEDTFGRMYSNLYRVITGAEEKLHCSIADTRNFVLATNGAFESSGKPHGIAGCYLKKYAEDGSQATEIRDISAIIDRAYREKKLFSEINIPWAAAGKPVCMADYKQFRLFRKSHIGNFFPLVNNYYQTRPQAFSYLSGNWADAEQWKDTARAKALELLNYAPGDAPLDPVVLSVTSRGSYRQEEIEFAAAEGIRVRGTLLVPNGDGVFPAIVALHDHGGFYYFGREKIVEQDDEPTILKKFKADSFGGRSWANEAAKRGYVVLTIDGFYFGSRKLDISLVDDEMLAPYKDRLDAEPTGSDGYIRLYNEICGDFEKLLVKHIFISGTTWPGMLFHDDRLSIDYLYTRKEVDKDRIGCCGLSLGGLRSAFLAGLDSRISCSGVAGWMPTFGSLLYDRLRHHTYMLYVPGLPAVMDLPDVVSLTAPNPLLVQQCSRDALYNMDGMEQACTKIEKVYGALGAGERFHSQFYDNKHEFNIPMQEDAFRWLDRWLKP
jgi:predicted dehydrogenase/dienelactone hydrolase